MNCSRRFCLLTVVLALGACDAPMPDLDGGPPPDAADAGDMTPCAQHSDCEDGLYCTIDECRPGVPGANARGCLIMGSPCRAGEMCSESEPHCAPIDCTDPDMDGDSHRSEACGGDDCDDDDGNVHPGVDEICDAAGVDDDCDPRTLGTAADDADGDGHIASVCCNGDTCGGDCDDGDASVNPDVRELCNGIDDNCSGAIDEEDPSAPLCPGGTCSAGRCSFTAFDRVFGGSGNDGASGLALDRFGNLYVAGLFGSGIDFGAGPETHAFLASFTPAGVLRWVGRFEGSGFVEGLDVAVDIDRDDSTSQAGSVEQFALGPKILEGRALVGS